MSTPGVWILIAWNQRKNSILTRLLLLEQTSRPKASWEEKSLLDFHIQVIFHLGKQELKQEPDGRN